MSSRKAPPPARSVAKSISAKATRAKATAAKPPVAKPTAAKAGKKASSSKAIVKKVAAKKAMAEPSAADKTAFAKAMYQGIQPGTEAARSVARKKNGGDAPQVEVLRKIPAPVEIVENEISARAVALAQEIEKSLRDGDFEKFQPHAQQALISAVCRLYSANNDLGHRFGAIGQPSAVNATDVMVLCGALLKAVDLQVFELGLWQSWSSR
ncbi:MULTISPECIES: hypothetical protein [unclassified Beijerinckia]|uniref:hypothetical protein n=1 Tax=unclassified Beijerinckia TaxID=2638183 RepID=UPI000B8A271E|nr:MULTISPECIES: hypothetical protein [unclassified Beijerinckia]